MRGRRRGAELTRGWLPTQARSRKTTGLSRDRRVMVNLKLRLAKSRPQSQWRRAFSAPDRYEAFPARKSEHKDGPQVAAIPLDDEKVRRQRRTLPSQRSYEAPKREGTPLETPCSCAAGYNKRKEGRDRGSDPSYHSPGTSF